MSYGIAQSGLLLGISLLGGAVLFFFVRRPPASLKAKSLILESRLYEFIGRIPDYAFFLLDEHGCVMNWNAGAERLSGYAAHEITGRHFSAFYTSEDRTAGKPQHALESAAAQGVYEEEGWRLRKDGSRFLAAVNLTALRDEKGALCGFVKQTRDISERKAQEAALRESEARYRSLFEHTNDALLLIRPDGGILSANPAACKLFGHAERELLALHCSDLLDTQDVRFAAAMKQQLFSGHAHTELRFVRKGGEKFEGMLSSKSFLDEQGAEKISLVIHDISERKRMENALRQSEERLRLLYENAPIGIARFDMQGNCTFLNRKFADILGYPMEEAMQLDYLRITLPEERECSTQLVRRLISGELDAVNRERLLLRKNGGTVWVRVTAKIVRDASGKGQYGIAVFEDITERKQIEEALCESEERYREIFEHAPIGISEGTIDGKLVRANPQLSRILGYSLEELRQMPIETLTHPADLEQTRANIAKLLAGEIDSYFMEKRYIRKDRTIVWVNVSISIRHAGDGGKSRYVIGIIEDMTARKCAEDDLKQALERSYYFANHDPLTGLANRAQLQDRLQDALAYALRDGHMVAVHLLDLDRFKLVNDTLGHHVGDLLLKEAADRIRSHIRSTDIAARLGGDEFVVVQTHLAEADAAGVLGAKLVDELDKPYWLEEQEAHGGASIGIALYPDDAQSQEELMKLADLALYEAKNRGRSNYQFYREEIGAAVQNMQRIEEDLARAWKAREFCLHYQPQFDLTSGRILGVEALIRWQHPERGLLSAADFILEAEEAGLTLPIGEWALQTACCQHRIWVDAGLAVPLAINISLKQLRHPFFLKLLTSTLEVTGLPSNLLQLELRESVLMDAKLPKAVLQQIKQAGVRLSLDDFGTESTALSCLHIYPLDEVKPGQNLMRELPGRQRETAIATAIIDLAKNLDITVCAEGVENLEQIAFLKHHGCQVAQGYFFSSPMAAADMSLRISKELAH